MILRLKRATPPERVQALREKIERSGLRTFLSPEPARAILAVVDAVPAALAREIAAREEIEEVVRPEGEWRLADRSFREAPSVVEIGGVKIGGGEVVVIAGPCSVESSELMLEVGT